jgi:hypothetical protein
VGAGLRANGIAFYTPSAGPDGAAGCQTSCVLRADLDLDTGAIAIAEKAPPECRDEAALAWLREELDGEVLDHLARVSLRTKGVRPEARREVTGFRPNRMVGFAEAFVTGRVDAYILDGRRLDVVDVYCVEPACTCTEMRFVVAEDYDPLGSVAVDLDGARPPRYEGPPILTALWQALRRRYPDLDVFRGRAAKVKEAGRDILARAAQPGRPVPEVGRNQPCPCGSGKKYKRCCLGKISAHG